MFNFGYGPVDVFQGLDMDAFLRKMQSSALPEKTEAEMKARQFVPQGYIAQEDPAPTSEAVTTTGSGSYGSRGIPSLRQMIFERYQPLVSQQRNYQSYIG